MKFVILAILLYYCEVSIKGGLSREKTNERKSLYE